MATERRKEELVRGVERCLEVQLGSLGGFELRPTRCFLWAGDERSGERIVSVGRTPRSLMVPRRERHMDAGAVHASVTCPLPGDGVFSVGAPGTVRGVAGSVLDVGPVPATFVAVTVKL